MPDDATESSALVRLFSEPREGWPIEQALMWVLTTGRQIEDPSRLTEALCERLLTLGAPIWRTRLDFRTLHPQVTALGFTWIRGAAMRGSRVEHGIEETDAFIGSPMAKVYIEGEVLRRRLEGLDPVREHQVLHDIAAAGGTDYLALPIRFRTEVGGCTTFATDRKEGYDDTDVLKLMALGEVLASVLEVMSVRHAARSLLDTYLGPRIGDRVLRGQIRRGDGESIDAAMWFSDLRDFTPLTESLPAREVLAILNTYFELVAAAVTARGGEILRFIGDAMLIVFPTSAAVSGQTACRAALDAAVDAFASLATLNHRRRRQSLPAVRFGIGLHVGTVIYGNVGAPDRLDFTLMGPAVNRTARLESLTKDLGHELLMSAEFARYVGSPVRSLGAHPMKGVPTPQEVFALDD